MAVDIQNRTLNYAELRFGEQRHFCWALEDIPENQEWWVCETFVITREGKVTACATMNLSNGDINQRCANYNGDVHDGRCYGTNSFHTTKGKGPVVDTPKLADITAAAYRSGRHSTPFISKMMLNSFLTKWLADPQSRVAALLPEVEKSLDNEQGGIRLELEQVGNAFRLCIPPILPEQNGNPGSSQGGSPQYGF